MSSAEYSYENFAVIIVLSGCGAAALFACLVLICCHFFLKRKESHIHSRYYTASQSGFERQTTSDENGDFFSYCFEESLPQTTTDVEQNADPQRPSPVKCELNANKKDDNESLTADQRIRCSSLKNKTRKASLPSKITTTASEEKKVNRFARQRRASISHGIVRQESFDVPEDEHDSDAGDCDTLHAETGDVEEMDEKSPETMRKQYRELWQLRATFEAEESIANESSEANPKTDARLSKNDSGYKSIERKDYSIDLKTETIFRQFTSTSLSQKSPHQSIQEENEQENEVQATYV